MLKYLIFFAMTFCFLSARAQDSTDVKKSMRHTDASVVSYKEDTIEPEGRNEILLNVSPFIIAMMDASNNSEIRYGLAYKRVMKNPRHALRFGVYYRPQVYYPFRSNNDSNWYYNVSDSSRIRNDFNNGYKRPLQLNAGFEWRSRSKKRWTGFFAIDVIAGYYRRNYTLTDYEEVLDSTGHWITNPNPSFASVVTVIDTKKADNFYIGIQPCGGLRYAFNPHWCVTLQGGFEMRELWETGYRRIGVGTALEKNSFTSFDFNVNGLLNEISLTYRF